MHDLRHRFASRLARLGADIRTIAELCGHADLKTTIKYIHSSGFVKKAAVDGLVTGNFNGDSAAIGESAAEFPIESK